MAKLVSKTYGDALFQLAMEEGKGPQFLEEVECIRQVLGQNPQFGRLMLHPGVAKQEKLKVIQDVFRGRVSDEMAGFLELIVQKERYGDLDAVFQYFISQMKEEQRIGIAYVTSAVELSEAQKGRVLDRLLATTDYLSMEVHYAVDPGLIGGMVIRIKDRVMDSSIRTKLEDLTKQLLQIQLVPEASEGV